jgi:hypothetical protein
MAYLASKFAMCDKRTFNFFNPKVISGNTKAQIFIADFKAVKEVSKRRYCSRRCRIQE